MLKTLTCPWCGASGSPLAFDVCRENESYWCPDCDGLFYLNPDKDTRRMLLFLETKEAVQNPGSIPATPIPKTVLRKRLSPLRYPGGKSKVIDQIYAYLDSDKLTNFVELFAGGASLGLSLLDAGKIERLILNDSDPRVANFWRACLYQTDRLCDLIIGPPPTKMDYRAAKEALSAFKPAWLDEKGNAQKAYQFLLLNRLSFGGIQKGGPICGWHGGDESLRQRWNPDMLVSRIRHIESMKVRIEVHCCDAVTLLTEHVGWLPQDSTIFVDPPYTVAGKKLYVETFENRHEELAELLNEFYQSWPGPDIILTYDDCPMVRDLYPYAHIHSLKTYWSINR